MIVPVYNEEEGVRKLLHILINQLSSEVGLEIILVDGGSGDRTVQQVEEFMAEGKEEKNSSGTGFSICLLHSEKGRAKQMNCGAKYAKGQILYFLHADSIPPKNFDLYIKKEVDKGNPAGCFQMVFDSKHWWLLLAGWFTRFNWRICRGGDQSLFIRKALFEEIGGYNEEYVIYEDNILISELYRRKTFVVVRRPLKTSARRYRDKGIWTLQYHFWKIHLMHRRGKNAVELYQYYGKHIGS